MKPVILGNVSRLSKENRQNVEQYKDITFKFDTLIFICKHIYFVSTPSRCVLVNPLVDKQVKTWMTTNSISFS